MHAVPQPLPCPVSSGALPYSALDPHFLFIFLWQLRYLQKHFLLPLTPLTRFNSGCSLAFLTTSPHAQCLCITPRFTVPSSTYCILHFYIWILLGVIWSSKQSSWHFCWFPSHWDGLFLSSEKVILEHQLVSLGLSSLWDLLPWDSSKQILEEAKIILLKSRAVILPFFPLLPPVRILSSII